MIFKRNEMTTLEQESHLHMTGNWFPGEFHNKWPFRGGACTFRIVMFNEQFMLLWFLTPYGLQKHVFLLHLECQGCSPVNPYLENWHCRQLIAAPDRETGQHGIPEQSPIANNNSWLLESTWLQFVSLSVVQARNSLHVFSDVNRKSMPSIDRPLYGLWGKTNPDL